MTDPHALRRHFREALAADPAGAYREWFRAQEELREAGDADRARSLADDFWDLLPSLAFSSETGRARFVHNAAVFFGSPGPAGNLGRARALFGQALAHFAEDDEDGWRARTRHNFATALSNLGVTDAELAEAVEHFEGALAWRTAEREIARGVTLHNLGLACRRRADLDPDRAMEHLEASASALLEAVAIRNRNGLFEGRAISERQLAITLERLSTARSDPR